MKQLKILILLLFISNNTIANEIGVPFIQEGHNTSIQSLDVDNKGKYVVSSDSKSIKVWELETGVLISNNLLPKIENPYALRKVKFLKNKIIFNTTDGYGILNLRNNKITNYKITDKHTNRRIEAFAISNSGKYIAITNRYNDLILWDIEKSEQSQKFQLKSAGIIKVLKFSHDDNFIISTGYIPLGKQIPDINFWNIKTKKIEKVFIGHTRTVLSVANKFDNKIFVSGSRDKSLIVWNILSKKKEKTFKGHARGVDFVALNNNMVVSASRHQRNIKTWSVDSDKEYKDILLDNNLSALSITPNGKNIISGESSGNISLWNIETGEKIRTFDGNVAKFYSDPNDENIYIWKKNEKVYRKLGLNTGILTTPLKLEKFDEKFPFGLKLHNNNLGIFKTSQIDNVYTGAFIEMKEYKFTGGIKTISINTKNLTNNTPIKTNTIKGNFSAFAVSKNDATVITGDGNGAIKKHFYKNGKKYTQEYKDKHVEGITSLDIYGHYILSGDGFGNIKISSLSGKEITWSEKNTATSRIVSAFFSKDGKKIYVGKDDGSIVKFNFDDILLFKLSVNKVINSLQAFKNEIDDVDSKETIQKSPIKEAQEFSVKKHRRFSYILEHGEYLIYQALDGKGVYIIDKNTGRDILSFKLFSDGEWVSITPEGFFNASKNGVKHLNILISPMKVVSIDSFYDTFYRPDLVRLKLAGNEKAYQKAINGLSV